MAMALKGSVPALLLALVVMGTWLGLASGQLVPPPTNDRFLRRHWDFPKTSSDNDTAYCDLQTRCRGIHGQNNTFIHSRINTINSICTWRPDGTVTSQRRFPITVCRFSAANGTYAGRALTRRIVVVCRARLPVRYLRFSRRSW